jgi:hypothetical protein
MNPITLTRRSVLLAGAALAACGGSDDEPTPDIQQISLNDHGPIFRSLSIQLSAPADVEVEYESAGVARLRVLSRAGSGTQHEIVLPRLRAQRSYRYRVRVNPARNTTVALEGSFATAALPADLAALRFDVSGTPSLPLLFLSVRSGFTGGVIVDASGEIVWYGRTDGAPQGATRRSNGHWVLVSGYGLEEFDLLGRRADALAHAAVPGIRADIHHGVTERADGSLVFLRFDPREFSGQMLYGEALWSWRGGTATPTALWRAWDFMDPLVDRGARSISTDWLHANHVSFGPGGMAYVSLHFLDQVVAISPDFSRIQWRLGGPGSSVALAPEQVFSGQHSARETAPGRVLMFDNGFDRAGGERYSRLIEFELDQAAGVARTVWQHRPSPDIWATVISSARRLPNGNTHGTFGTPAGVRGSTGPMVALEVTPGGTRVSTMLITGPAGTTMFQGDPVAAVGAETLA